MNAFDLRNAVRERRGAVDEDPRRLQRAIFHLLTVLLEHEADKANDTERRRFDTKE
jgi:hypothetical protein